MLPLGAKPLLDAFLEAVRRERMARDGERQLRDAAADAVRHQVLLRKKLRDVGVPATTVARHMAELLGEQPSPAVRKRIAARLRKRESRAAKDACAPAPHER